MSENGDQQGGTTLTKGSKGTLVEDSPERDYPRLTAVELDEELAARLAERFAGTNLEVVCADATGLPFEDDLFSPALTFTMLHHVPTDPLQDRVFEELRRVLRPGGCEVPVLSTSACSARTKNCKFSYQPSALSQKLTADR